MIEPDRTCRNHDADADSNSMYKPVLRGFGATDDIIVFDLHLELAYAGGAEPCICCEEVSYIWSEFKKTCLHSDS